MYTKWRVLQWRKLQFKKELKKYNGVSWKRRDQTKNKRQRFLYCPLSVRSLRQTATRVDYNDLVMSRTKSLKWPMLYVYRRSLRSIEHMTRNVRNVCTHIECIFLSRKNAIVVLEMKSGRLNKYRRYTFVSICINR